MNALEILKRQFGFDRFLAGQEAVVGRLLQGRSTLAVFPTGGGKSLCYQLPALVLDGLTLVISPLLALMKDQIDFLASKGIAAGRLDSTQEATETRAVHEALRDRTLKLLYISPERLGNERFLRSLRRYDISLLAVDEAHCISQWGHNFRPDYLRIAQLAAELSIPRVLALTATATPAVSQDIAKSFAIAPEDVINTGFYRPNLKIYSTPCGHGERDRLLIDRHRSRPRGPTIVYVTLQKAAERVAEVLSNQGFDAQFYHAGMEHDDRRSLQDAFMASRDMVVVATIAFGMGIDKSDIRYVYHYNLPKWFSIDVPKAVETLGETRERIVTALGYLEERGDLTLRVAGVRQGYRRLTLPRDMDDLSERTYRRFLDRERQDIARVRQVLDFASHDGCMVEYLLDYFGAARGADCGHCGHCEDPAPRVIPETLAYRFTPAQLKEIASLRSEGREPLSSPRQLTRFLCGLPSPKATRAKLSRHPLFGRYADIPFADVLRAAGG